MSLRTAKVFRLRKSSKLIKNKDFRSIFIISKKSRIPLAEVDSELATAENMPTNKYRLESTYASLGLRKYLEYINTFEHSQWLGGEQNDSEMWNISKISVKHNTFKLTW